MFNNNFSNTLTIILVTTIVLILGTMGVIIVKKYNDYKNLSSADTAVAEFENSVSNNNITNNTVTNKLDLSGIEAINTTSADENTATQYKGFDVVATIQIPSIDLKYPVLKKLNKSSLETSVVLMYTSNGVNEPGNTVIIGHNYKNGTMFSNVKKLEKGNEIYITDLQGRKIKYIIYDIYRTSGSDGDYLTRETNGKREISLSTCTDDSQARTIVLAREE